MIQSRFLNFMKQYWEKGQGHWIFCSFHLLFYNVFSWRFKCKKWFYVFIHLFVCPSIYLFSRERGRCTELFLHCFTSQISAIPNAGPAKARILELNPIVQAATKYISYHLLLRVCIRWNLELEVEPQLVPVHFDMQYRNPKQNFNCYSKCLAQNSCEMGEGIACNASIPSGHCVKSCLFHFQAISLIMHVGNLHKHLGAADESLGFRLLLGSALSAVVILEVIRCRNLFLPLFLFQNSAFLLVC